MGILLLTFCLILSTNTSYSRLFDNTTSAVPSQTNDAPLNALLDEIEAVDEPALRVFLRLKITAHLLDASTESDRLRVVAAKTLADLREHKEEIPDLYANLFRSELTAQMKAYALESAVPSVEQVKVEPRPELEVALSLLGQENGIAKAVNIVESYLAGGKDPGPIIVPFLRRLEKVNSTEVPNVLNAVISVEETHPGSISARTLFTLKHLFVSKQVPQDLRLRYFAAVINRAGEIEPSPSSAVDIYTILVDVLPSLEKQAPELYYTANARLPQLVAHVPKKTLERISVEKRVRESSNPLVQLMVEKDSVSDPSLKEELQVEAARLALEVGKTRMAIELVVKLQPKEDKERLWRDQFIEKVVGSAAERGDVEVARYGISQIQSAAVRLTALEKVALQLQASDDSAGARDALNSALRLIEAWDDDADKAAALLDLASIYLKVDSSRAPEIARAAVKTINKIPSLSRRADLTETARLVEAEKVMKVAYSIVPTFRALIMADKPRALTIAKEIRRQELKTAVNVSVYISQSAANKNERVTASR